MIVIVAMLFAAWESTSGHLWLFTLFFQFGWGQGVSNTSHMQNASSAMRWSPFLSSIVRPISIPTDIRLPRAVKSSCLAPPQPANGEWRLSQDFCEGDDTDCKVPQGTELGLGYRLVYTCSSAYRANGDNVAFCGRNGKWSIIPECVDIKCNALNSETRIGHCTRFRKTVSCDVPMLPQTKAQVSCRPGYKEETTFLSRRRNMLTCNADGKWDPDPLTCTPVCGQAVTHQKTFIIGGSTATIGDFPWHVSLYMENWRNKAKDFICGATLIKTNFLLTAAHCVYDDTMSRTVDSRKFFVMTGNIYRDYDHPKHDMEIVRKGKVKNVYVYFTYIGLAGNYGSDIALLELEQPFSFSHILLPVCLDNGGDSAPFLEPGLYGRLAGFGRTATDATSPNLQTIEVPYVSYAECKSSKYAAKNEIFVTQDKFCAGYTTGSAVCEGDSGGGLVFQKNNLWYLMGIVSVGLGVDLDNGEQTCERFSYTLYTKVSVYTEWILETISDAEQHLQSRPQWTPDLQPITEFPTPVSTVTPMLATPTGQEEPLDCLGPPPLVNGQWKAHSSVCDGDSDCDIPWGAEFTYGDLLILTCNPGFKISGDTSIQCEREGRWSAANGSCIGCRPPNSPFELVFCFTESGTRISCADEVPTGTRALCRFGHKLNESSGTFDSVSVKCNSNRKWEPDPRTSCAITDIGCRPPNSPFDLVSCITESRRVISCGNEVPTGTRALCRLGHKLNESSGTFDRVSVKCNSNRKWEPDPRTSCATEIRLGNHTLN